MRSIRIIICAVICIGCVLSLCACGMMHYDDTKEKTSYGQAIATLFEALDREDEDAIYNLFSPAVREQDGDLSDQVRKLISVYEGPVSEIGWDGLMAGGGSYEHGEKALDAYCTFPVRCGDTYYWCYMKLMYENTTDENQIGIIQLEFYTEDEYYILCCDDSSNTIDSAGLHIYAEQVIGDDVRCIKGLPYKYSASAEALDIDEVNIFFTTSNSFEYFKARFGEPNAEDIFYYYDLPDEGDELRYLEVGTNDDGTIHVARIVDDFMYIDTVFSVDK